VTGGGVLWVRWWTFGFLHHGVSYCLQGKWESFSPKCGQCTKKKLLQWNI
jgi:hypothetical protein